VGRFLIYTFVTFMGTGYAPIAPATVASFAFMIIWIIAGPVTLIQTLGLLALTVLIGVPAATWVEKREGKDPSLVVSDEVAGMLITYMGIATTWPGWLAGFFLFRFFDIAKPFPVRRLEKLPGGWGITADDMMAGVYANICLRLLLKVTGW
jgi:phosphatidylglycerophosphatase A